MKQDHVHFDKEQKVAIILLSVSTILENFIFMLYIHTIVLFNGLFFPEMGNFAASLLSSLAFCSICIFRPIGSYFFGWLGSHIGRGQSITITTFFMVLSCMLMGASPLYADVGSSATWFVTVFRIMQGLCFMGQRIGAEIYLTEITKPPIQYSVVSIIEICMGFSAILALGALAVSALYELLTWRATFYFSSVLCLAIMFAQTKLKDTPEFAKAKIAAKIAENDPKISRIIKKKFSDKSIYKTSLALFALHCTTPIYIYLNVIYFANVLRKEFSYSVEQIVIHNLYVSIIATFSMICFAYLANKIYPLSILAIRLTLTMVLIILLPILLDNLTSSNQLLFIQSFYAIVAVRLTPASAIFYKYFPVLMRFTSTAFIHIVSLASVTVFVSFGSVCLNNFIGNKCLWFIMIPLYVAYAYGLKHFWRLEEEYGRTDEYIYDEVNDYLKLDRVN